MRKSMAFWLQCVAHGPKAIIATIASVLMVSAALAQGTWLVTEDRPPALGPQVLAGQHNHSIDPDATWVAPALGNVQAILYDAGDVKCGERIGYVSVSPGATVPSEATVMPVPTAPFRPGGDCTDPVDFLWASIQFTVSQSNTVALETGGTSGRFFLEYVTATPTPVVASRCLSVRPDPPLAPAIPASGVQVDIHIEAENPQGYIFFDGQGYLFFEEQPLRGITIYPGRPYKVSVSAQDVGCAFGNLPTNLKRSGQPTRFTLKLPYLAH